MSALDLIFGAQTAPEVSQKDISSTSLPSWYQKWLNQTLGKASSVANEPYQTYGGPRIAPTSGDTTAAYDATRANVGAFDPTLQQGIGYTGNAGSGFNEDEFNSYMNPYVSGVVDRIGTLAGRNLSENLLPAVNDSFIRSGQFGSSRNADFTLRALRDTNESALAAQNQALAQSHDSAMQAYGQGRDRQLNAGNQLGSLAQLGQGMGLADASALQSIGQAQEDKTQQSLNLGYQDFLEQRDYPRNQVDWFSSILRGYNPGTTTTSTSTGPANQSQLAPNPLSSLAGTALGLYGLSKGFKKGGRARHRPGRTEPQVDFGSGHDGPRGLPYYKMAA